VISAALRLDPLEVDGRVRSLVERLSRDETPSPEAYEQEPMHALAGNP
jgi:hypothetical protein